MKPALISFTDTSQQHPPNEGIGVNAYRGKPVPMLLLLSQTGERGDEPKTIGHGQMNPYKARLTRHTNRLSRLDVSLTEAWIRKIGERRLKIGELHIGSRGVNMDVKVAEKTEERQITSRTDGTSHRVAEAKVGDDTGCILLTLWDSLIDEVQPNDNLRLENGYVSLFKGSMRLNVGRYGKLTKIDTALPDVNVENNLSERVYQREFGGERGGGFRRDRFGEGRRRY